MNPILRIVVGLDEEDSQLILKQYTSNFGNNEVSPGIYTTKDTSEAVYTICDHEGTLQIEYDDNTMKTKLILKRFGKTFSTLRFEEACFFNSLLGFTPFWGYKPTNAINADFPGIYTGDKILILSTIDKIHMKCDVFDGSIQIGSRHPILFSFLFDKKPGFKVFCEPETIHYKKIIKSVLNTIRFFSEDDNNEEVDFIGETLTFALQIIKI